MAFKVRLEDGSEMGPLDVQMLRSWYQQGMVTRKSEVRRTGTKKWVPLVQMVDISSWGESGGSPGRAAAADSDSEAEAEDLYEELSDDPQRWRMFVASVLLFLIAAGAGYLALYPARWLPALKEAPWREIALGHVALGLLLLLGRDPMRKLVRVVVFLMTFSLFAAAAPVLIQGVHWRPLAILASAWVMGSGLFFFLAGRALRWTSIALCLFWILAGAAGVGALGFVPPDGSPLLAEAATSAAAARSAAAASWSPSAAALSRDLPMLSPRAAELIVSYGLERPEAAFKTSYLLAANGVGRLTPQEARELGEITSAVYAPIAPQNRKRLDGYMERVRRLQVTQPQEDREMTSLVREGVLQLPEAQRARYQFLYEKALGASR